MNCFCFVRGRQYKLCSATLPSSRPDVPSSSANNLVHQKQPQNNGSSGETLRCFGAEFWTGGYSLPWLCRSARCWRISVSAQGLGTPKVPWVQSPKNRRRNTWIISNTFFPPSTAANEAPSGKAFNPQLQQWPTKVSLQGLLCKTVVNKWVFQEKVSFSIYFKMLIHNQFYNHT